jgi:hypothetical protein
MLTAAVCLAPRIGQLWIASESPAMAAASSPAGFLTKPIEEIRPGDRVLAHNPELSDDQRNSPEPDPATWLLIELELTEEDGHRVEVRLLRPREWIEARGGAVAQKVRLDIDELGVSGEAALLSVSPCPPIKAGSGSVVTGAFRHVSDTLVDVHVEGQPLLGCTAGHLFWSEDREEFVRADALKAGELVGSTETKHARVVAVTPRAGQAAVFNLEVNREHVYYVGPNGVLVHNSIASELFYQYRDHYLYSGTRGGEIYHGITVDPNQRYTEQQRIDMGLNVEMEGLNYLEARGLEQYHIETSGGRTADGNINYSIDPTRTDDRALAMRHAANERLRAMGEPPHFELSAAETKKAKAYTVKWNAQRRKAVDRAGGC